MNFALSWGAGRVGVFASIFRQAKLMYPDVPIECVLSVGTGYYSPQPSKAGMSWNTVVNQLVNSATVSVLCVGSCCLGVICGMSVVLTYIGMCIAVFAVPGVCSSRPRPCTPVVRWCSGLYDTCGVVRGW